MVNGYSLYDMAGNVWEWCWDNWQADWYAQPNAGQDDTKGPITGSSRIIRGASYGYSASSLRVAERRTFSPTYLNFPLGLRPVRRD
jgi:formylglycine-generating enzyme required for sulfatase activity